MRRALARALVLAALLLISAGAIAGCDGDSTPGGDGAAGSSSGGSSDGSGPGSDAGGTSYCPGGTFVGDLQGLQATAQVTFSESIHFDSDSNTFDVSYVQMGGEVTSSVAYYLFAADLYGYAGYGDMTDVYGGETFRIYIQLTASGFVLTTNPYEGLYSTSYVFSCQ